jgi:hypothetical protein
MLVFVGLSPAQVRNFLLLANGNMLQIIIIIIIIVVVVFNIHSISAYFLFLEELIAKVQFLNSVNLCIT